MTGTTSEQDRGRRDGRGPIHEEPRYEPIIIGARVCGITSSPARRARRQQDGAGGRRRPRRLVLEPLPGSTVRLESVTYGYSFSEELLQEWDWKERSTGGPRNLRYLSHVVDEFDLRRHIQFGSTVESAEFDDEATLSRPRLADGHV